MQLNVIKTITESSAVSLGFWRKPSDTDMQTTLAVSGSISAKYWINIYTYIIWG